MNIEGTYTLQVTPEEVWRCLMDPEVLRRSIPGVERLERENHLRYAITIHIRQTPLIGLYQGHVTISDQQYPRQYRLTIDGEGKQSKISGEGVVQLNRHDENTVVHYKGTLNAGKLVTLLPPPLVQGAAKLLIQQFFTELAEYLRTLYRIEVTASIDGMQHGNSADQESIEVLEIPAVSEQVPKRRRFLLPLPVPFPAGRSSLLLSVVRRLGLGEGDPAQEAHWVERVRRFGFIFTLLLLVWVGTRLPRR
ncbi:MAG TPA: carbon monoxide dehydrogenase subunit G [Ktedonobacteraceae bacterium]|nr:carbon monoxide dehydrogenase subunit G [Ktedonobacteraceae bacterium]